MLTLYHAPKTRSTRIVWLLEELGEPYTVEPVRLRTRDPAGPGADYLAIHPHGKVPAIRHDGTTVFESGAICLYLTDAFPKAKLGPLPGEAKRGEYLTWLFYYQGVVELAVTAKVMGWTRREKGPRFVTFEEMEPVFQKALDPGPFMLGENFSAADILFGSALHQFVPAKLFPPRPEYLDYIKRLNARPAYNRAMAKDAQAA